VYLPKFLITPTVLLKDRRLKSLDLHIYGVVYWFARLELKKCFLKNENIAEMLECSTQSVKNSLARLGKYGYLQSNYDRKKHIRELVPIEQDGGESEQVLNRVRTKYSTSDLPGTQESTEYNLNSNEGNKRNVKREYEEDNNQNNNGIPFRNPTRDFLDIKNVEHNTSYLNGIVNTYLELYKEHKGSAHPYIKGTQLKRVKDEINAMDDTWGMDLSQWERIIAKWFSSNIDTDHNINHFAQEQILQNLYYETIY